MISCAKEASEVLRTAFPKRLFATQECFVVMLLNTQNMPIGKPILVSMGTVSAVSVHPRDVFREAVKRNATSIIVAHNHLSGNCEPSSDDSAFTNRLLKASEILGIPLLDHLILTKTESASLKELKPDLWGEQKETCTFTSASFT